MKIKCTQGGCVVSSPTNRFRPQGFPMEADVDPAGEVELERVYNGIGIQTDQGHFGIAQRDAGIEVMLDGKLIWSSTSGVIAPPKPDCDEQPTEGGG